MYEYRDGVRNTWVRYLYVWIYVPNSWKQFLKTLKLAKKFKIRFGKAIQNLITNYIIFGFNLSISKILQWQQFDFTIYRKTLTSHKIVLQFISSNSLMSFIFHYHDAIVIQYLSLLMYSNLWVFLCFIIIW